MSSGAVLINHSLIAQRFHPFYQAILNRAIAEGFCLPSIAIQIKQNALVEWLVLKAIWSKLEFLYMGMVDSCDVNFSRINWIFPSDALAGVTGVSWSSLNGWGNAGSNFDTGWTTARIRRSTSINSLSHGVYSRIGGANTGTVQNLSSWSGANGRFITIRARLNPRTDGLLLLTVASPQIISAGNTLSNTIYGMNLTSGGGTGQAIVNASTSVISVGNIFPDTNTLLLASGMHASKYVGAAWLGEGMSAQTIADMNTGLRVNYALTI